MQQRLQVPELHFEALDGDASGGKGQPKACQNPSHQASSHQCAGRDGALAAKVETQILDLE